MKILWITDDFLPHLGGSRLIYYYTMKCFSPGEVTVLTKRRPGWREFDSSETLSIKRGFLKKLPGPGLFRELPLFAEMLLRGLYLLLKTGADVIVCGELMPTGLVGRVLNLLTGRPYILYLHGEEVAIYERLRGEKKMAFSIMRAAPAIVATAREVRDNAVRQGVDPAKIHLLTPGVPGVFFERSPRPGRVLKRYGLEGKRIILTVARLVERKGHEAVIRVLPDLIKEFGNCVYLVVGIGPSEQKLKRIARELGVAGAVVFAGRKSQEELVDYYAACDVFAMPNRELADGDTEGAGVVFLEAAALGKPVIAGRVGGTGDSVADGVTGFRVDPALPEELGKRLSQLLGDRDLARRMGEAGRRIVLKERRWEDRASGLREICQRLVKRNHIILSRKK